MHDYLNLTIPVEHTQQWHQVIPRSRHTPCPIHCQCTSRLSPHLKCDHQQVSGCLHCNLNNRSVNILERQPFGSSFAGFYLRRGRRGSFPPPPPPQDIDNYEVYPPLTVAIRGPVLRPTYQKRCGPSSSLNGLVAASVVTFYPGRWLHGVFVQKMSKILL